MQAAKVAGFQSIAESETFLRSLREALLLNDTDYRANKLTISFSPIKVIVWSLDLKGAANFAQEKNSQPGHSPISLFFNEGACRACQEISLRFNDLGGIDKTIPGQAREVINENFRPTEGS